MKDDIEEPPVPLNTSEDALQAYLTGRIDEKEFRTVLGRFSVLPGHFYTGTTRPDDAYATKIPDDLYYPSPVSPDTVEDRVKAVQDKAPKEETDKDKKDADKAEKSEKDNK